MLASSRAIQSLTGWELVTGHLRTPPPRLYLMTGHSKVYTASLVAGCATRLRLAVVDGGMRFSSYLLSRLAGELGLPARTLLRQTHLSRSFTAFQTEAVITDRLPTFLERQPCGLVLLLAPLQTYYDDQITPHEAENSLRRSLAALKTLSTQQPVLIADAEIANPLDEKAHLFEVMRTTADVVWQVQPSPSGYTISEQRSIWDVTTKPSPLSLTGTG
ncbi:MAG: hypothetical protein FJY97_13460 [candidate division Zixibacteria bacterium]|nr:hypothetical protein [candidate division Zixibacteria bacterium]